MSHAKISTVSKMQFFWRLVHLHGSVQARFPVTFLTQRALIKHSLDLSHEYGLPTPPSLLLCFFINFEKSSLISGHITSLKNSTKFVMPLEHTCGRDEQAGKRNRVLRAKIATDYHYPVSSIREMIVVVSSAAAVCASRC